MCLQKSLKLFGALFHIFSGFSRLETSGCCAVFRWRWLLASDRHTLDVRLDMHGVRFASGDRYASRKRSVNINKTNFDRVQRLKSDHIDIGVLGSLPIIFLVIRGRNDGIYRVKTRLSLPAK